MVGIPHAELYDNAQREDGKDVWKMGTTYCFWDSRGVSPKTIIVMLYSFACRLDYAIFCLIIVREGGFL